jgi:serine phosphatase RsbU (regulator of sigma subunit)
MTAVAGTCCDFLVIRPGCLGIVVADVAGHGVPAALVGSLSAQMDSWSRAWQGHRGVELHALSPSAGPIRDGSRAQTDDITVVVIDIGGTPQQTP